MNKGPEGGWGEPVGEENIVEGSPAWRSGVEVGGWRITQRPHRGPYEFHYRV